MSNKRLLNPSSGNASFGAVPEARSRSVLIPAGSIYLSQGRHIGPNRGFGARHIWAEHPDEMRDAGFASEEFVPHFVAQIIKAGTPLYFEGHFSAKTRLIAVRGAPGLAILELRYREDEAFWSIVTAYRANKKHGVRIGTVL